MIDDDYEHNNNAKARAGGGKIEGELGGSMMCSNNDTESLLKYAAHVATQQQDQTKCKEIGNETDCLISKKKEQSRGNDATVWTNATKVFAKNFAMYFIVVLLFLLCLFELRNRSEIQYYDSTDDSSNGEAIQHSYNMNVHTRVNTNQSSANNNSNIEPDIDIDIDYTNNDDDDSVASNNDTIGIDLLLNRMNNHNYDNNSDSFTLRWGVIGLGRIAHDFVTVLKMTKQANVTAVAAGSLPYAYERAKEFAEMYDIPTYYGTYEELAQDPNIHIVYIATTNQLHYNNTMLMLKHGHKNVLVEKPLAMTYQQSHDMFQEAQKQNLLLLTNYWTRFFPVIKYTKQLLQQPSSIGSIVAMNGDFAFVTPPTASGRYLSTITGGGAMLDIGCYLINIAVMVANANIDTRTVVNHTYNTNDATVSSPSQVLASGQTVYNTDGVDYHVDTEAAFILRWRNNSSKQEELAAAASSGSSNNNMIMSGQVSFQRPGSFEVVIDGTKGRITIKKQANCPDTIVIDYYARSVSGPSTLKESEIKTILNPIKKTFKHVLQQDYNNYPEQYPGGAGFIYVIDAIHQCMYQQGIPPSGECLEMEELTIKEQLLTDQITDEILHQIGYWE